MYELIEKLNKELMTVKESAAFSPLTAEELSDHAYRIAIMQLCIDAIEYMAEGTGLSERKAEWVMEHSSPLEYLYGLWLDSDYSFVPSLAEVLDTALDYEMEVSA